MPTYDGQAQEVDGIVEWNQGQAISRATSAFVEWRQADGTAKDIVVIVEWRGPDAASADLFAQVEWKLRPSCTGDLQTNPTRIIGEIVSGGTVFGEVIN